MKKLLSLLLAATLALGMTACGKKVAAKPETTSYVEGSVSHYPVTITNYDCAGETIEITFEKTPKRALAVYQNSIETLLALGLEDNILAASGLDHQVKPEWKEAFSKVNYLTEFEPDKEKVVMMQPDLILGWGPLFGEKKLGGVDYWHNSGIKTYISANTAVPGRTMENEYADILNLGKIFNVEDRAEAIVGQIKAEVKRVQEYTANATVKKKILIVEFLGDKISNYDKSTLAGDMVSKLGAELPAEGKTIGAEDIVKLNPDVIFVVYMDSDKENMAEKSVQLVAANPVFASLAAVQNKAVFPVKLGEVYASGVRTIDGVNAFAKGLYPELY